MKMNNDKRLNINNKYYTKKMYNKVEFCFCEEEELIK